jgi:PAS domain S-box-containing protein
MADVMPAMFWMKSPAVGRVIYLSAAADQIYGYKRQDFYQQPSLWSDVIHPEDRERVVAFCEGHRGEATETEYRIVRRDGEVRWVRDVASAVRNQAGEPEMLAGFVEDITERKHAETQLRQADRLSSLGLMAGGIAHGLRNPLSVISACAQMLLDFPNDASLRTEAAEKINAATKRASQIIESLLQFARPGDVPMTAVDVVAAAEEALVLLAEHLLLHRVTLCKELPPGLPAVRGNGQLLRQVFVELVLNACSAMPQGGTLTVAAATLDARWVEVRFQDTGQGIPSEHLSRIFDPFFTTKPSGTGLGLSVSHAIITQHEGTIGVASTVGQGATFTIRLPRAAVADTEPA